MEEEGRENTTPFWVQSSTHRRRIPRPSPSLFINSGVLLFTLCITFLALFILFILPSLSPQIIFKPSLVKKSWDSLNIALVLLALLFGFLSRNINHHDTNFNGSTPRGWYEGPDRIGTVGLGRSYSSYPDLRKNPDDHNEFYDDTGVSRVSPVQSLKNTCTVRKTSEGVGCGLGEENKSDGLTPRGWYGCSDRTGTVGLRRSYGSYPDLREIQSMEDAADRWRFYDDMSLDTPANGASRVSPVQTLPNTGTIRELGGSVASINCHDETGTDSIGTNNVGDVFNIGGGSLVQEENSAKETRKLAHGQPVQTTVPKLINDDGGEVIKSQHPVPDENVDLESNPTAEISLPEERVIKQVPAVSRRTRRTADTIANKGKSSEDLNGWDQPEQFTHRKTKSTNEIESKLTITPSTSERKTKTRHFLDSFRKKKKKQRQKSADNFESLFVSRPQISHLKKITVPPPPPPPAWKSPAVRPPLLTKPTAEINRFMESPLHPIPPPPPLPPFKMPKWKFVVKGDYVKIGSMSMSPDSPTSSESGETPTSVDGGDVAAFCPSPDVNSKADMFIAKFRAGLKLQKMNSMKQKSNLGPR